MKKHNETQKEQKNRRKGIVRIGVIFVLLLVIGTSIRPLLITNKASNTLLVQVRTESIVIESPDTTAPTIVDIVYKPVVYSSEKLIVLNITFRDSGYVNYIRLSGRFDYEPWKTFEFTNEARSGELIWSFKIDKDTYEWFEAIIRVYDRANNMASAVLIIDIIQGYPPPQTKSPNWLIIGILGGAIAVGTLTILILWKKEQLKIYFHKLWGRGNHVNGGKRK